jgi:outer membrane protein OmpA-like peptidoglycan-associated protein
MKKSGLILVLLAVATMTCAQDQAQAPAKPPAPKPAATNAVQIANAPTESDMYCSGYITAKPEARSPYVAGGWGSPHDTHFSDHDFIYLSGGGEAGSKYHIVRSVKDENKYEFFPGQFKLVTTAGRVYQEIGRVRVTEVQKGIAIAEVEFSCDPILPGDIALPWEDRPTPQFRREAPLDRFAQPNGKATGRIVGAKDFDYLAGHKSKVYLNIGANQGLKPGDYLRATRTHTDSMKDEADKLSYKASVVDSSVENPPVYPKEKMGDFPRRSVGEMMVLYTTPTTSTAMVTKAIESIYVGDGVELEDELPPLPPPPAPVMNPPTVSCSASPATIRVGETSRITCTGESPDQRDLTYTFAADNGTLNPQGSSATFDARNARPGLVNITTTVADDRGLNANATTRVNVEAAPVAAASKMGDIIFKSNSARVDNAAKAMLDGVALRAQREPGGQVLLAGGSSQPESARLGPTRATNAKSYLTAEKGIDSARVQTADAGKSGSKAEVYFVPAGAAMPTITAIPGAAPAPKPAPKKTVAKKPAAPAKKSAAPAKPAPKVTPSASAVKPSSTSATKPAPAPSKAPAKTTTKAKPTTPPKA